MTIIDIVLLVVLAFSLIAGMHKGFIASGLSLAGFFGSWYIARMFYEKLADLALSNESLMSVLSQYLETATTQFSNLTIAGTSVSDLVASGANAVSNAVASIGGSLNLDILKDVFQHNVEKQAFSGLGLTTVGQYLDRTIWEAAFHVLSFVVLFVLVYLVINLIVNLLNRVIRFPVLRGFDAILGGVFGLVRGAVVAILLLVLAESAAGVFLPKYVETVQSGLLYNLLHQIDLVKVGDWIRAIL